MRTAEETAVPVRGARIEAAGLSRDEGGRRVLEGVSLTIGPGELVAVLGGSGAGKSTLLETLAGLRAPSGGEVRHDGARPLGAGAVGFVPQDDIIHTELPLRRTLRYAARLRLPAGTTAAEAGRLVEEILRALDLSGCAETTVGALSGGQRKRASLAVELLSRPRACFLDEPTSGLDPAISAEVLRLLRGLCGEGVTVVLTTHAPADAELCDRVVFLAPGGRLVFSGTPAEARLHFGVSRLSEIYALLAAAPAWTRPAPPAEGRSGGAAARPRPPSRLSQWRHLTRRNADVLLRNRLTLAILLGSPLLVTAMMALLFEPGAFDPGERGTGAVQVVFWVAFDGFFFGLTYGLLQLVGESAVFRRERFAGLSVGAYLASKVTVLLPLLAAVSAVLLGALRLLDRLPEAGVRTYALLLAVVLTEAVSALALGLLASAAVRNAAQAALALPLLCFPQVLFAGAVVPSSDMALPGRLFGRLLSNGHAFEALGSALGLGARSAASPGLAPYSSAFDAGVGSSLLALAGLTAAAILAAALLLHRRTRPSR